MNKARKICRVALTLSLVIFVQTTTAEIIFSETFDNYSSGLHPGLPQQGPNGSDEVWYGARFEAHYDGTIEQDIAVNDGAYPYSPYGRVEDEAGLLFKIDPGYEDITLSFQWRTHNLEATDCLKVTYYVGNDLGFSSSNRIQDFVAIQGGHNQAVTWYGNNWTDLLVCSNNPNTWTPESLSLPDSDSGQEIWVAFWMDNGEGDKGKIDNILVTGIPEPSSILLIGFTVVGLTGIRRRFIL